MRTEPKPQQQYRHSSHHSRHQDLPPPHPPPRPPHQHHYYHHRHPHLLALLKALILLKALMVLKSQVDLLLVLLELLVRFSRRRRCVGQNRVGCHHHHQTGQLHI